MPIPDYNSDGLLPAGIFTCSLEEIEQHFGRFRGTDRRPNLTGKLIEYMRELRSANIAKSIIINGSYITDIDQPNDIDVLLILKDDIDLSQPFPPFIKNTFNNTFIKGHYKLDFKFGFENHISTDEIISLYSKVKGQPDKEKGLLKIILN